MMFTSKTTIVEFAAVASSILWFGTTTVIQTTPVVSAVQQPSMTMKIQPLQEQYPNLRLRSLQTDLPPLQDDEEEENEGDVVPVFEVDSTSPSIGGNGMPSSDDEDDDDRRKSYQDPGDIVRVCDGGIMSSDLYVTKCKADSTKGNVEIEDSTSYKVKTGPDGIIIEMKYESEIEEIDNSSSRSVDDSESEEDSTTSPDDEGDEEDIGTGDGDRKLRHEHGVRRRKVQEEEVEIENKFEALFHTMCLYRKAGSSDQEPLQQQQQQQQETAITTAQQRQNNGVGEIDATIIEFTNDNDRETSVGNTNSTTNNVETTSPPNEEADEAGFTIDDVNSSLSSPSSSYAEEAFEWGVDSCDVEINLMDWSSIEDLLTTSAINNGDNDEMSAKFSSVGNNIAEFLFSVVQRSTTDLSANSIKFDLNVDGVAAQLSGTDYHLAMFADIKTKQKIEIEGASSDDANDESSEGPSSSFVAETGTKSSTSSEIKDITVPFASGLSSSTFTPLGHFSWKDEAEATSTTVERGTGRRLQVTDKIKVVATVPTDQVNQKDQTVAFSFTGPGSIGADYIHWDPEAGVGYQSSSSKMATFFGVAAMVTTTISCIMF